MFVVFYLFFFFFQAEDGIRDAMVTGVQTCALPIWRTAVPVQRASGPRALAFRWASSAAVSMSGDRDQRLRTIERRAERFPRPPCRTAVHRGPTLGSRVLSSDVPSCRG